MYKAATHDPKENKLQESCGRSDTHMAVYQLDRACGT